MPSADDNRRSGSGGPIGQFVTMQTMLTVLTTPASFRVRRARNSRSATAAEIAHWRASRASLIREGMGRDSTQYTLEILIRFLGWGCSPFASVHWLVHCVGNEAGWRLKSASISSKRLSSRTDLVLVASMAAGGAALGGVERASTMRSLQISVVNVPTAGPPCRAPLRRARVGVRCRNASRHGSTLRLPPNAPVAGHCRRSTPQSESLTALTLMPFPVTCMRGAQAEGGRAHALWQGSIRLHSHHLLTG